jgi:hypothetical protein
MFLARSQQLKVNHTKNFFVGGAAAGVKTTPYLLEKIEEIFDQ